MYERLTYHYGENNEHADFITIKKDGYARYRASCEGALKLAAYEDSGLSPEEVQGLAKAKADGRMVVLPCKVGDTVYRIISYKCNAVCNKLNACNSFIYKGCKQAEFYVCPGTFQLNDMWWIGKTVFLTREAAEEALGVGE
jgi:hypothetical protein